MTSTYDLEDVIFLRHDDQLQGVFGGFDSVHDLAVGHSNHGLPVDIDKTIACENESREQLRPPEYQFDFRLSNE